MYLHALGHFHPETLLTNDFLQDIGLETDDAWITERVGIRSRHTVLPDYITFEMPESSVLVTDPGFIERLVRLRMMGYGLAIDDYGTGRSNLQLLARVPFTEL